MKAFHYVDTHAHLCDAVFEADLAPVLRRAREAGVVAVVAVGEDLSDARRNLDLARQHPLIKPAAGLYPAILDESQADAMVAFVRRHPEHLSAIGEVGLDYWLANSDAKRQLQRRILLRFVRLALELDLPLNVHSRSAGRHTIELLIDQGARRVQMHAFDGKAATARPALAAGYFFSVPPSVVRSRQQQKLVHQLPMSHLLLETDSPVLGADANQRNEPANIVLAAKAIAEIKKVAVEAVIDTAWENSMRLYGPLW
jgi:TatD DNase family protein